MFKRRTTAGRLRNSAAAAAVGVSLLAPMLTATPAAAAEGDDWLRTEGNTIVDANGNEVWLTGANWFGLNTTERFFHGLWSANIEDITKAMADRGLNMIRVPISTELMLEWRDGQDEVPSGINTYANPELEGLTTLEVFDYWLDLCDEYGLKVMLDVHSAEADNSGHVYPMWYKGDITPEDFYVAWEWITERYKNDDTILAMDVQNEPHGKHSESPRAKWDDSEDIDNWKHACETAGNRILDINPNVLIMCEGIEVYPRDGTSWSSTDEDDYHFNWWGGNLRGAADHPIDLGEHQDQLVYSPHDYGPSVHQQPWFEGEWDQQSLIEDVWRPNWFYLHENETSPLFMGEWGGHLDGGDNEKWMTALRGFMIDNQIHHTFWSLNPNSGDTGGLLDYDWSTWNEKYDFLKPALWQHDGKFVGLDHEVPLGSSATGTTVSAVYGTGGSDDGGDDGGDDGSDDGGDDGTTTPELKAQYKNSNSDTSGNQIRPVIQVSNTGSTDADLSRVSVRYYLTKEGSASLSYTCDYAAIDCSNVSGSFQAMATPTAEADTYLELSLSGTLAPNESTGDIQNRINKSDWSNFDESNDYSHGTNTSYADAENITIHVDGELVWGTPPA
ncbi:cellulase family glycosylhydrolase [Salinactinospora qingdaonensis]|uniref:Endoglucanase n=1 Tax=Salinactinospora qingdaonensis TaxID=702744 RepID=A0ABP7FA48_9ACTN